MNYGRFAIFGLFSVYQLYRFSLTHSLWLVLITAVDSLVIGLTWYEYLYLRRSRTPIKTRRDSPAENATTKTANLSKTNLQRIQDLTMLSALPV